METKNGIKVIKSNICSAKKDKLERNEAIQRASRLSQLEGWEYRAYSCPICKTWHIGHTFPRRRTTFLKGERSW